MTIVVTGDALDECFGRDVLGEGAPPMERAVRAWAQLSGEPAASCEAEVAARVERLASETGREELVARREELAPLAEDARVDLAAELAAAEARADEARQGADERAIRLADERVCDVSRRLRAQRETDLVAVRAELAVIDAALDRERRVRVSGIVVDQPAEVTALVGQAPEERAAWLRHWSAVGAVEDVAERVVRNRTASASPGVRGTANREHVLGELDRALGATDRRPLEEIVDDETAAGALAAAAELAGRDLGHPAMQRQVRAMVALVGPERAPAEAADAVRRAFASHARAIERDDEESPPVGSLPSGRLVATMLRLRTGELVDDRREAGEDVPMAVALASLPGWGIPEVRAASEIAACRGERGMDAEAPEAAAKQPERYGQRALHLQDGHSRCRAAQPCDAPGVGEQRLHVVGIGGDDHSRASGGQGFGHDQGIDRARPRQTRQQLPGHSPLARGGRHLPYRFERPVHQHIGRAPAAYDFGHHHRRDDKIIAALTGNADGGPGP